MRNLSRRLDKVAARVASKTANRVYLVRLADFDESALCTASFGNLVIEQKVGEPYELFCDRAVDAAKEDDRNVCVLLKNLYVLENPDDWDRWRSARLYYGAAADRDKVYRPTHCVGQPLCRQ
jgi:hypothetical protein